MARTLTAPAVATNAQQSEAQVFAHLRERAGKFGHSLTRVAEPRSTVYMATCWGMSRRFEELEQLGVFVDLVTGALDARIAERAC